jgi:hypothetical protein
MDVIGKVSATLSVAVVLIGGVPTIAEAAATRYAVPTGGSGTACTSGAPCDVFVAVESAANGDEVILASGDYNLGSTRLDLTVDANVHGTVGSARPRLFSTATTAFQIDSPSATLSDVRIEHTGFAAGLSIADGGGAVDRVFVNSTGGGGTACVLDGLAPAPNQIHNSVCRASGASGAGVAASVGSPGPGVTSITPKLVNVTAIASGTSGVAVVASPGAFTSIAVAARNVIARGATSDAKVQTTGPSSSGSITFTSSNYATETDPGVVITDPGTAGNQTAPPLFVDAAAGDLHQLTGSPTINAGTADPSIGTLDLDGAARTQETGPDIGAYEFGVTPPSDTPPDDSNPPVDTNPPATPDTIAPTVEIAKGPAAKTTKSKAKFKFAASESGSTFECKLNSKPFAACSSPAKFKRLKPGKHRFQVQATDPAGNTGPAAKQGWKILNK